MNSILPRDKKRANAFYVFIVCCSILAQPLQAQQNFDILHFTNDNFLPQNSVSRVAFDKYGYTWLCTQFGLVRYDGSHFRTYNTFNTPSIKNNRFVYVASDSKGNIYAVDGRPVVMQVTDTGFVERMDLRVDSKGLLSSFHAEFMNVIVPGNNHSLKGHEPFNVNDRWQTMFNIDSVRFYFTSAENVGYFDGTKLYVHRAEDVINSFQSGGMLFTLLTNGTFNIYKNDERVAMNVKLEGDKVVKEAFKKAGKIFSPFTPGTDSNAYIFYNRALYVISGNTSAVTARLICDSLEVNNCIYILHNATTGSYYLCSQVEGLYILVPKNFKSLSVLTSPGNANINAQYAIMETGKNEILSAANNYLYKNKNASLTSLNINSKYCFYRDNNHHLFFQGGHEMCETDTFFHILARYALGDGEELKCVNKDSKGMLWAATHDKLGTLENDTFHFYRLGHNEIESFTIQQDSLIWIATREGLFLFHTKNNRVEEKKMLSGNYVRALKPDDDGTLWIGTYGQGFYRYKDDRLVKFPLDKNGYLSIAHCFMEDNNGFFWIPSNRGLFQVKKSDLNDYADGKSKAVYYQYYDKSNGFTTNEFDGGCNPCGIRTTDGSFILPSLNSLVSFNPEAIRPMLPSSPIFIDKISADSISYSPGGSFTLSPGFHQLVFEVSSVYYGNVNNNNIEYHISGLNDDWYLLNADGKITITSLPHGTYKLQLRRLSGFGLENYIFKNISFAVAPKFFETIWFRLLALLLVIIFTWLGFRIRYDVLKRQKLALEKQVEERTITLQEAVQELQQSENVLYNTIQEKEKITSILVHDLKSPLRFLTLVSDHIHSQIDQGNTDELKKLTSEMKKSSRRISMFTDEFLAWLLAAKEDFTAGYEIINLKLLADEIVNFFEDILTAHHNILEVNIEDGLTVIADERLLRVILRNLIDNANKHTRKGIIQLECVGVNKHVEIKVIDNGNGMNAEQLKSFSDLDGNSLGFSLNVANQLGSRIVRNFIHKLGGTLTAESEVGKGTTITLKFKQ